MAPTKPLVEQHKRSFEKTLKLDDPVGAISVHGHTDAVPVQHPTTRQRFGDNWGLAAARANAVLRFLESEGIPGNRMHAVAFSYWRPADEGRAPNARTPVAKDRRVEIWLQQ